MHFTFDKFTFLVAISPRPIILDGQPCKARTDFGSRRILLSDQLPRTSRRKTLFHELRHCWVMARGRVEDVEADADDAAEMMTSIMAQYEMHGGDAALESMDPEPVKSNQQRAGLLTGPLANTFAECGNPACGVRVAVGSIANGKAEWSEAAGQWLMDRGMCCAACDQVTVWREVCSAEGMPLGAIVAFPPPRVLRGAEAAEWINDHAELCNIRVLV